MVQQHGQGGQQPQSREDQLLDRVLTLTTQLAEAKATAIPLQAEANLLRQQLGQAQAEVHNLESEVRQLERELAAAQQPPQGPAQGGQSHPQSGKKSGIIDWLNKH